MPPRSRVTMLLSAAWVSRTVAMTCSLCICSCISRGASQNRPFVPKPALFTNSVSSGSCARRSATRVRSESTVRSASITSTCVGLAEDSSAASWSSRSFRRAMRSRSCSAASLRANAAPIPLEAPVIAMRVRANFAFYASTISRLGSSTRMGR